MSNFNIERLRSAVRWAESEAEKRTSLWDQGMWMLGKMGKRVRRVKTVRFTADISHPFNEMGETLREVRCGTSYCVAGHICADEGDSFVAYESEAETGQPVHADLVIPRGATEAVSIQTRAQELLGITNYEANRLFEGFNDIDDVREIAEEIANSYGHSLNEEAA